ncbi:MAG TPA: hypothetical protein VGG72_21305 [Bryobacteraceae bacterium]|jgi:hypothetical protein
MATEPSKPNPFYVDFGWLFAIVFFIGWGITNIGAGSTGITFNSFVIITIIATLWTVIGRAIQKRQDRKNRFYSSAPVTKHTAIAQLPRQYRSIIHLISGAIPPTPPDQPPLELIPITSTFSVFVPDWVVDNVVYDTKEIIYTLRIQYAITPGFGLIQNPFLPMTAHFSQIMSLQFQHAARSLIPIKNGDTIECCTCNDIRISIHPTQIETMLVPYFADNLLSRLMHLAVFRFDVSYKEGARITAAFLQPPPPPPPIPQPETRDGFLGDDSYWATDVKTRTRHIYVPGQPGSGKTSLLSNLVIDDITRDDGPVIAIDPKGGNEGLIERVLPHIPKHRIKDVIYVSLRHPAPIDLLGCRNQFEKNLMRSDITGILQRFSFGNWGPTMQETLNNLVPTLLEAEDASFLDLGKFLESKERRDEIISQLSEDRKKYWKENPPNNKETGPIAGRMSNFKEEPLKTFVSARRGEGINIAEVIDRNQILLIDMSPKSVDGYILGALIMSKIQQAIFRRSPGQTVPLCHVYADEFHNFVTSGFSELLTEGRSFNISLCLANQHPGQIKDIWDDVLGISSYLIFQLDGKHIDAFRSKVKEPLQQPPTQTKDDIRSSIRFCKERIEALESSEDDDMQRDIAQTERRIFELECELDELSKPISKAEDLIGSIPTLETGQAVYIDMKGDAKRIRTRKPPQPAPCSFFEEILANSRAQAAQIRTIRTGDNFPSNSPGVRHDEVNDTPQPSGPPRP